MANLALILEFRTLRFLPSWHQIFVTPTTDFDHFCFTSFSYAFSIYFPKHTFVFKTYQNHWKKYTFEKLFSAPGLPATPNVHKYCEKNTTASAHFRLTKERANKAVDKQTEVLTDRQTDRQTDKQIDRLHDLPEVRESSESSQRLLLIAKIRP